MRKVFHQNTQREETPFSHFIYEAPPVIPPHRISTAFSGDQEYPYLGIM